LFLKHLNKNKETFYIASKEVGLQVNTDKIKYVLIYCHKAAAQTNNVNVASKCSEKRSSSNIKKNGITNKNCIYEKIKSKLNLGSAC
jgi:hypothetical protein